MQRNCFDEEHEMFRKSVRDFAEKELAPHAEAPAAVVHLLQLTAGEQTLPDIKFNGGGDLAVEGDDAVAAQFDQFGDQARGLGRRSSVRPPARKTGGIGSSASIQAAQRARCTS